MEADDAMAIEQMAHLESKSTCIATRDKDLRMVPGYQYGWECGRQPEFRKRWVDELGDNITLSKDRKSIKATGQRLFYAQMLTGDTVDCIPGCEGYGAVGAYEALKGCDTIEQLYHNVRTCYIMAHPDHWEARLQEMANLLWMIRELNEDGSPVFWTPPNGDAVKAEEWGQDVCMTIAPGL